MNSQYSLYVNSLDVSARDWHEKKLEYGDSADMLPDLYCMQDGWQNDPECNVRRRYLQIAVRAYLGVTITLPTRQECRAAKSPDLSGDLPEI